MAKDKSEAEKRERKEAKKDKKRKAEDDGDDSPRKEKKSKRKSEGAAIEESAMDVDGGESLVQVETTANSAAVLAIPLAALVPFANPLADDKAQKKVLKGVKKGSSHVHTLLR